MKRPTQDIIVLSTSTEVNTLPDDQLRSCPDCSDTMNIIYDWDKISYSCENCGLTIANSGTPSTQEEM